MAAGTTPLYNRRDFLAGSLAAGALSAGGVRADAPALTPIKASGRIPNRVFWTWDHSTTWCENVPGSQNCGVANPYLKKPPFFGMDYRRVVDWCAAHGMQGVGIVGLLRDRHGGVDAARRLCGYARDKGVRIYAICGLFAYSGIYYEGESEWCLNNAFKKHPDWIGSSKDGSPLFVQYKGAGGSKCDPQGCPSNPELRKYVLDSLDWLFKTIPELGGIQMEAGDNGVCQCAKCRERRGAKAPQERMSVEDMALAYPPAGEVIRARSADAWVICESYHHFLDEPCRIFSRSNPDPNVQKLLDMPESTIWQWMCDRRIRGKDGSWSDDDRMLPDMRKFHHVMRAHTGTQWFDGRHTLGVDLIRRQCRFSYMSGLDGVSMFGENSPFHANSEFNYLALTYFSEHPLAEVAHFARDEMAPRLGGWEYAQKWLEFAELYKSPAKVPAAVAEIAKIVSGISDYEVQRRWFRLADFLNAYRWESEHYPDLKMPNYSRRNFENYL